MPRRVTDASRRNDDDSDSDDWRTSTTQRTPKRRAVSTASFYETSDGRNLGAEYKKIDAVSYTHLTLPTKRIV